MLVHLSYAGEFGGDGENRTLIGWVQTSSPPVERRPHDCRTGCGGGNRTHLMAAYETAVRSSSSSPHRKIWSAGQESNLRPSAYQTDALTRRAPGRWSPAPASNRLPRFTGAAHRQQCLRGAKLGAGGANRTLVGRRAVGAPYQASALPLSYTGGAEGRIRTAV